MNAFKLLIEESVRRGGYNCCNINVCRLLSNEIGTYLFPVIIKKVETPNNVPPFRQLQYNKLTNGLANCIKCMVFLFQNRSNWTANVYVQCLLIGPYISKWSACFHIQKLYISLSLQLKHIVGQKLPINSGISRHLWRVALNSLIHKEYFWLKQKYMFKESVNMKK